MKVMVVSFLLDGQLGGGAANSAWRLCLGLAKQGIEVVAVTTHEQSEPITTVSSNIRVHNFRPRNLYWVAKKDKEPLPKKFLWQLIDTWNPHVYQHMRKIIRQEMPDVIHVQKLRGLSPAIWSAAAAENCRPIIQTCRDYELVSPEGLLDSRVGRMAMRRHWSLLPYQGIRSRLSNKVDVVTAPSQFTLKLITDLGFFSRSKQIVVPNSHGMDLNELNHLASNMTTSFPDYRDAAPSFLYLGRLETEKGIDVVTEAFAGLVTEFPHIRLDVAGNGTRAEALRAKYATTPQIRFHGHVSGAIKDDLIKSSLALIMPSIVQEVFGNSIIEAYAFGKPVIASRIGGMPENVEDGITGTLVEPGNIKDLQQAIVNLLENPEKLAVMSSNSQRVARKFTNEAVTEAYLAIYEEARSKLGSPKYS